MSMIHEITAAVPRYKDKKRRGRGESSGHGKTSGRGTKGSGARTGTYIKLTYEGGQTPMHRRLPTRGFSNENFERNWYIVNLTSLNRFDDGATVDASVLEQAGLVPDAKLPVKILGNGELTKKLNVVAGWYSKSAHQKITAAGGTAQNVKTGEAFEFPKEKKRFVKREGAKKGAAAPAAEAAKPAEGTAVEAPKAE